MKGSRGITLIELVLAILILAMGTIAVMQSLDQSRRGIGEEPQRAIAARVAANRLAEIRIMGPSRAGALPGTVEMGGWRWTVETSARRTAAGLAEITVTARAYSGGPGGRALGYVASPGGSQ